MEEKLEEKLPMDWKITNLIAANHLFAIIAIWYGVTHFSWQTVVLAMVWFLFTGFSITAGYHRLFTHQSYKAARPLRLFYLCFGAAAAQGSVVEWVNTHSLHHASDYNPRITDPHDIGKGFWWAHIGWLLRKMPRTEIKYIRVLWKDSIARWQYRNYVKLLGFFGFALPGLIAYIFWGDLFGGLLLAGSLRTVLVWHMTWSVNSVAHQYGDNLFNLPNKSTHFWPFIVLLIALGELIHSFHHRFSNDCRNGWKWYHPDPTKWLILTCSKLRLAWELVYTENEVIEEAIRVAKAQPKVT